MEGMKQWKDLTLVYETSAGHDGSLQVTPEGGSTKTIPLPATTGRATQTFPLDTGGALMEGKSIVVKVTPSVTAGSKLILYEGSVRLRQVGEYLATGEFWETQPLTFD